MDSGYSPARILRFAHGLMALCFVISLSMIIAVYGYADYFSLGAKVAFHIGIVIFPALFKLSYLLRLNCLKQLNLPVN